MPYPVAAIRNKNFGSPQYGDLILSLSPIAYWPLNETSGTVAVDATGNGRNGTYQSDVSGWTQISSIIAGQTAPSFDGTNNRIDIYSASLAGAFDATKISVCGWAKIAAAQWTDGTARDLMQLGVDASNYVKSGRSTTNNQIRQSYVATTAKSQNSTYSGTDWFHWALVVDKAGDTATGYVNGTPTAAGTSLGVWAGALSNARCVIGSANTTGTNPFIGGICHVAAFAKVLTPAQVASLAVSPLA